MKFIKHDILYVMALSCLFFAHSCITMRTRPKEAKVFFNEANVSYKDSTITVLEQDLHYVETGNPKGPNLVFVHGSPGSWDAWKGYLVDSTLKENYRLIAVDRPGFGYSNFRRAKDLTEQAQILNELLRQIDNGQEISLIGHSYGGPLIVKMALEGPELFKNLVILAGALDPDAEKPEKWRKPLMWVPLKYVVPGALRPSNDELWWLKQDLKDMKPQLKDISQHVLIIHGTKDNLVPYSNVPYMENVFSNAASLEVIRLENENHFIVWTQDVLIKDALQKLP